VDCPSQGRQKTQGGESPLHWVDRGEVALIAPESLRGPLALNPFRFRHPHSGKWIRARHKMQVPEPQRHGFVWEIIWHWKFDTSRRATNVCIASFPRSP
jgi:hypothetical protein